MGKQATIVRLSSKGQVIIPAEYRRKLGLRTGQPLAVRSGTGRELVFSPAEDAGDDLHSALKEARAWFAAWRRKTGRDPLEEFHERRKKEREREAEKRERWRR
jgi:AbrB family looped-hinge helix DNA binding protein